jgi:hypothetical protein
MRYNILRIRSGCGHSTKYSAILQFVHKYQLGSLLEFLREQIYKLLQEAWSHHGVLTPIALLYTDFPELGGPSMSDSTPEGEHHYHLSRAIAARMDILCNEKEFLALLDTVPGLARDILVTSQFVVCTTQYTTDVVYCGNHKCRQNRQTRNIRPRGSADATPFVLTCVACFTSTALSRRKQRYWTYLNQVKQKTPELITTSNPEMMDVDYEEESEAEESSGADSDSGDEDFMPDDPDEDDL